MVARLFFLLVFFTSPGFFILNANAWADWSGPAQVKDGDTFYIDGRELRPGGIDAPELKQVCTLGGKDWLAGLDAKAFLKSLLAGKTVSCLDLGPRSYNRPIVRCYLEGRELQEIIVRAGWAFDWPKYSGGRYAAAEAEARAQKRGVWRGRCEKPWSWRRRK